MIGFCPLASGSKGNSIYLGTEKVKLLIDAGISAKQMELRLSEIGVALSEIDAILITHEHTDHIAGLNVLAKKIPVLVNSETAKGIYHHLNIYPRYKIFTTGEPFEFEDLRIEPFSVQHDTLDPVGFVIHASGKKIGFCTDLGIATSLVKASLKNCDYLYLEANHQVSMVEASSRHFLYKQRVLGRQGHLSNDACAELLLSVYHPNLKHVYLAHLSSECNSEEAAIATVSKALQKVGYELEISVAHQDRISKRILF